MNAEKLQTNRKERNGKMEAPPTLFQNKCIRGNWVLSGI
jgi:hypothetical protein